ncbi:hypothetical protein ABM90_12240 [Rhodococcus erythropolis]|nr:hypothetical protein ABM90_12240 [Rhodococcus erythropolis]
MKRRCAASFALAGFVVAAVSGCAGVASGVQWAPAAATTTAPAVAVQEATNPGLDQLIGTLTVVDTLPNVPGYERGCGTGEAPLTELNAEWCRSEGVGSMWVGSLRT